MPPILWTMIVNHSGQRKTALLDNAFAAIENKHRQVWRHYMTRLAEWKAAADEDRGPKPDEPHSFRVGDITAETLQTILAKNDRGTLLIRDEIAGFFEFGRYAHGARGRGAGERSFYLESYEARPYTVHRLGRDSLYIAINGLTVYGHIQPDRLSEFIGLESDGLLQRFVTIRGAPASIGRALDVTGAQVNWDAIITALTDLRGFAYRTTPEGGDIIRQMERDGAEYATLNDYGVGFQGFCGKLHGTLARVALNLHLLDDPRAENSNCIPTATVGRADRLVRQFILPHAVDFYGTLSADRVERTRAIAAWLLTTAPARPDIPTPANREWKLVLAVRTALAERAAAAATRREEIRQLWKQIARQRRVEQSYADDD